MMTRENQPDFDAKNLHTVDWESLPAPQDDGAADHLEGCELPSLTLQSTDNEAVDPGKLHGLSIIFIYPMTASPDTALPEGWDMIPGARGCTPQACAFRDINADLSAAGVKHIFGLSVQSTDYQQEASERLHLPYPLLSDEAGKLQAALKLPTMDVEGERLLRRLVMAVENGRITKVWYPVFPPDESAQNVLNWLKQT